MPVPDKIWPMKKPYAGKEQDGNQKTRRITRFQAGRYKTEAVHQTIFGEIYCIVGVNLPEIGQK